MSEMTGKCLQMKEDRRKRFTSGNPHLEIGETIEDTVKKPLSREERNRRKPKPHGEPCCVHRASMLWVKVA
jgi:hypothetical protein